MAVEKVDGLAIMRCDECEQFTIGPVAVKNVDELRRDAKAAGWRTYRLGTEWINACENCVRRFAQRQRG